MNIQKATLNDIDGIETLLYQVHKVHSSVRPDLFKVGSKKYTREQIINIILNPQTPIYVYKNNYEILGYAFIVYMQTDSQSLVKIKSMYIDDLCVSEKCKNQGIGSIIFNDLEILAKQNNCYNIVLNVYNFNVPAMKFYKKHNMIPLKTYMEKVIK